MATYKKTAKEKGQLLYEEAMKSGRVLNQGVNPLTGKKGTGQAIATPTGLQKITKTNAQGLQVGGTRNAPGAITELTPTSYEDIGKIQQENDYQATLDAAQELGLGENAPTKMDEYIKMKVDAKKRQDASQNLALEGQRMDLRSQGQAIRSESDYGQAMAASGLTGPQTNTALAGGYQEAAQAQLARLKIDDQRLAMYAEDLKDAQASGDLELAQSIQAERDAYTNQAMANEAAYVQALGDYEKTKAAVTQSNLSSFQSLVDEGQELSVEAISGFAGQLGIPFEDAYGYYAGLQSIRDDKSLSLEEKDVAIQQAKQDLNDQINGLTTEAAKKVSFLDQQTKTWREAGYSTEEIAQLRSDMRSMLGIETMDDPGYQAEVAYKSAQAQIAQNEANGVITSPLDLIDLAQKTYDYYESIGYDPSIIPTGGKYGAVSYTTPDGLTGVRFAVEDGANYDDPTTERDESQCGAFVNDVTGIGMGDDYATEKMDKVDKSIKVPAAGMVYVQKITGGKYAKNGHTGMVEYFNPETSMVGVVSANANGDGAIVREEVPLSAILNGGGFAIPPNYEQGGVKQYNDAQRALMDNLDPSDLSSTDLQLLENSDLSSNDLYSYISSTKTSLAPDKKAQIQEVYDALGDLKDAKGQAGAVGFGWEKLLAFGDGEAIPGTEAAGFIAKFNTFKDSLALPNLDKMKGAMSDKDIQFLRNTASSLSLDMNEETFNETLDALDKKYRELLTQGTSIGPVDSEDSLGLGITSTQYDPLGLLD